MIAWSMSPDELKRVVRGTAQNRFAATSVQAAGAQTGPLRLAQLYLASSQSETFSHFPFLTWIM